VPKAETTPRRRYTRHAGAARDPESLLQSHSLRFFLDGINPRKYPTTFLLECAAVGAIMPGRIWCSDATLSPGMDHHPWPCAVTRERESTYKRTRRTDTALRPTTSDAGFTRGLFPTKPHPCRFARDLWSLRTSLTISENVFSSMDREPLGGYRRCRAVGLSYPRGGVTGRPRWLHAANGNSPSSRVSIGSTSSRYRYKRWVSFSMRYRMKSSQSPLR
jgi:hypothetical protein